MALVEENNVSILIPAYGSELMTIAAIQAALHTGAGEILVSEDLPDSNLLELTSSITDSRLKIYIQSKNLGLWQNHLFLLRMANHPWVKFLQTDDYISPECLKLMCAQIGLNTSIVSVLPRYKNLVTNQLSLGFNLPRPVKWKSSEYLKRLKIVGNELGRPSDTLVRKEYLDLSEEAWQNDQSCDLLLNVVLASKGEVVLLPPGCTYTGIHPLQDGATQSFQLSVKRLKNTLSYIKKLDSRLHKEFVAVNAFVELFGLAISFWGRKRRSQKPYYTGLFSDLIKIASLINIYYLIINLRSVLLYSYWKFKPKKPGYVLKV